MTTKDFGTYTFSHIVTIQPVTDADGKILEFMPQAQYKNERNLPFHKYGQGPFCQFRIPSGYPQAGVYILTVNHEPYYVGECLNLSLRYNMGYGQISPRNCYQKGQPTNCRLNNLVYETAKAKRQIDLWFMPTSNRKTVEAELIQLLNVRQRWNRKD